jgi:hypothetical protein
MLARMSEPRVELFYWLKSPDETSDYAQTWVNGEIDHPFALPGVSCRSCGVTWASSRVLPLALPHSLASDPKWQGFAEGAPVSDADHAVLRAMLKRAFASEGIRTDPFLPGDAFLPAHLSIPTTPVDDFLWPGLTPVVSTRVRDALVAIAATGIVFAPVVARRIGPQSPRDVPPMPPSGEPDDLLALAPLADPSDPIALDYHEMVITTESALLPGCLERARCNACGRVELDLAKRRFEMSAALWRGRDVFLLGSTRYVFVTSRVRDALLAIGATHVDLRPGSMLAADLDERAKARRARIGAFSRGPA